MTEAPTFIDRQLLLPRVAREVAELVELPSEVLFRIAEIRNETREPGFQMAQRLRAGSSSNMSLQSAISHLRVADNLIRLVDRAAIDPAEAARQIATVAADLDPEVQIDDVKVNAITAILSATNPNSPPIPVRQAMAYGPHFGRLSGAWSAMPVRGETGGITVVPILALNIEWHDHTGVDEVLHFRMTDAEWEGFMDKVAELNGLRQDLAPFLDIVIEGQMDQLGGQS